MNIRDDFAIWPQRIGKDSRAMAERIPGTRLLGTVTDQPGPSEIGIAHSQRFQALRRPIRPRLTRTPVNGFCAGSGGDLLSPEHW